MGRGQGNRGDSGGKVADLVTEVAGARLDPAGDHDAVVAAVGLRVADVVAGSADGVGEQSTAGAVLGLCKYEDILVARGQPAQLALGALE